MNHYRRRAVEMLELQLGAGSDVHQLDLGRACVAMLVVPHDMTTAEAERVTAWVDQIAIRLCYQTAGVDPSAVLPKGTP